MPRNALVLGGGAPNFTLMTGALLAFEEAGIRFDVVTGAGGGGAVALTYLSPPNGMTRRASLVNSVNYGVSDAIYNVIPMNYKMFMKGGKLADLYRSILKRTSLYKWAVNQYNMSDGEKLLSDFLQAWWSICTPTTVNFFSKGICANAPFIELMTDFEGLKHVKEEVYLSAYCLTDHKMVTFSKEEIDMKHFGASLSYPFLYPPTEIEGKLYIEGATEDPFNFAGVLDYAANTKKKLDNILVLNPFGYDGYLQPPPNLWQAWGQSLISPLVPLDKAAIQLAKHYHKDWSEAHPEQKVNLLMLDYDIPSGWAPTALDWSRSNLQRLFHLGHQEGKRFLAENWTVLTGKTRLPEELEQ